MPAIRSAQTPRTEVSSRWFAVMAGLFAGIALLKFGNPIILEHLTEQPTSLDELLIMSWPLSWGHWMLGVLTVASLVLARPPANVPRWVLWIPLAWLGWQFLSATQTVDTRLTADALKHFTACVVCFYIGLLALARVALMPFLAGLGAGFLLVLASGFNQHYGGLEETRRFVYEQIQQGKMQPHPHMLAKLQSTRIFSTLVYPNALAGVILLLLPAMLALVWRLGGRWSNVGRGVLTGVTAYAGLACLYWSGSKSGWLIALAGGLVVVLQLPLSRRMKSGIVVVVLATGLVAFFVRFDTYFQKGAKSIGARVDYWRAATQTAARHPVLGSGPGTFYVSYRQIKPAEAEMARLAHNDYLQQASDSGFAGFVIYAWWVFGSVGLLYRKWDVQEASYYFPVWLGLIAWFVQGFVEFALYIPASAWVAFLFFGWLWGVPATRTPIVTTQLSHNLATR